MATVPEPAASAATHRLAIEAAIAQRRLCSTLNVVLAELAQRGVVASPLNLLAHALDVGFDEETAVLLSEIHEARQRKVWRRPS